MEVPTPAGKRLPFAVAAVAVALVAIVAGGILGPLSDADDAPTRPSAPPESPTPPVIQQAPWRVSVRAAGATSGMSRKERKRLRAQRSRTTGLVRALYDALFLRPATARRAISRSFDWAAGRSFRDLDRVGVPDAASVVRTLVRSARVTIEAPRALHAVASVRVKAQGRVDRRAFRLVHRATLWLTRREGRWRVIAYEVNQEPLRA